MVRIKQADYERISKDYRGIWNGKRTVFASCISKDGGTRFAVEGIDDVLMEKTRAASSAPGPLLAMQGETRL